MDEFYNQLAAEFDIKRDLAYQQLNEEYLGPNAEMHGRILQNLHDSIAEEYAKRKQEIRWDIAWQVFDEVNERQGLNA